MYYNVTLKRVRDTIVAMEKQKVLHVYVCACAVGDVHACACVCVCVCVCVGGCTNAGVWFRACSLTYPACNAHTPYCMRSLWFHHIFRYYLINYTILIKSLLNVKCVSIFCTTYFDIFLVIRRIQRDIVINVKTSSFIIPVILVGL